MMTPEDIVDLLSTPSLTLVFEEQAPAQQSISPLDLYKSRIPESVKEKVDKDTEIKSFFDTLPELFQLAQKIHTRTPLYTGSSTNPQVITHLASTFTRPDQEGDIIGHVQSTIKHINPQP